MDDQFLPEFLAEAEDLIEALFGDIALLRARHGEGRARRELVGRIFRQVHTIKGAAFAAGLEATGKIAHEFESLLEAVRKGRVVVEAGVLDAFEDAMQAISENISAVSRGKQQPAPPTELVERLRRLVPDASTPAAIASPSIDDSSALAALPEEIVQSLSEQEMHRLRETTAEGAALHIVRADFNLATFDEQFRSLSGALSEVGEVISTLPGVDAWRPERVHFRLVYATHESRAQLAARIEPFGGVVLESKMRASGAPAKAASATVERGAESAGGEEKSGDESGVEARASGSPSPSTSIASVASLTSLVRVPLEELDDLISSTHELFNETAALLDIATGNAQAGDERDERETRAAQVRKRFIELEERLIGLRMVSVGQTLERVARAGLSAARLAGKNLEIELAGGDVRLDKSLADTVAEPLLHLLRNAIDHAVEPPAERLAAGKHASARVRLEAETEGSRVMLRVTDDGRGIDPERIARAAIAQGIFAPGVQLTEQQSMRLIFRPGFSTAGELSSMSGRGVGLDVVESAVEQLGGEIRVWSRKGAGTTFEMRLPTTLALVSASIVQASGHQYCVDTGHVLEEALISSSDIEETGDGLFLRWREEMLPLVHIGALLSKDCAPDVSTALDGARVPVIISRIAARSIDAEEERMMKRAAVAVDKLGGYGEVLVRSLGRHATRWRGVSGATELRDGSVALLLDLPRLLEIKMGTRL